MIERTHVPPTAASMNYINLSNRTAPNQQTSIVNTPGVGIRGAVSGSLPSPATTTTAIATASSGSPLTSRHVLPVVGSRNNPSNHHHQLPKMTNHNHANNISGGGGNSPKGGGPTAVPAGVPSQTFQHRPMPALPSMPASMHPSSSSFVTSTPTLSGGKPIVRIRTPHPHDVLCGRGGGINSHPGNKTFRSWVHQRKEDYNLASSKQDKAAVSREVMDRVRALNPPGRFLMREENSSFKGGSGHPSGGVTGFWIEIDDNKAMAKTSQALREGAPKIRAAHNVGPDGRALPAEGESSEGRQPQRRKRKAAPATKQQQQQPQHATAPPPPPQSRKVTDEEIKRHIRDAVAATRSMPRGTLNNIGAKAFPPSPKAVSTAAQAAAQSATMSPPGAKRPKAATGEGPLSPAGTKSPRSPAGAAPGPGSSQSSLTQRLLLGQQQQQQQKATAAAAAAAAASRSQLQQLRQQAVARTAVPPNLVIPPQPGSSVAKLGAVGVGGGLNGLMKAPDLSASFNVNAVGKQNNLRPVGGGVPGGPGPASGGASAAGPGGGDMTTPPLIPMSLQSPPITPRGNGLSRKKSSSSSGSYGGHLMRAHSLATSDITGPLDSDTLDEVFTDPFSADAEAASNAVAAAALEQSLNGFESNSADQQQTGAGANNAPAPAGPVSALTSGNNSGYNVTWNLNHREQQQQQQQPLSPQRQQQQQQQQQALSPQRQQQQAQGAAAATAAMAPPSSSPIGIGNVNRLARQVSNRSTASQSSLNSADLMAMYGGGTNASRITS